MSLADSATTVANQFVEVDGRRLAYRVIGAGTPLLLCLRFRGTMDDWNPAFLDALAARDFRVHVFDYSASAGPRAAAAMTRPRWPRTSITDCP